MIIKEAQLKQIPEIVKLWKEFMIEHDEIIITENPKLQELEIKDSQMETSYLEFLKLQLKSAKGTVFIAEENNKIVGYTLILIKDEIPIYQNKKIGCISDLYVKKNFRNRGLSSRLKDKSIEWFKEKGIKFVSVPLYPDNKFAHSLYQRWGFFDYKLEMRKKI